MKQKTDLVRQTIEGIINEETKNEEDSKKDEVIDSTTEVSFETTITATGFGKFNYIIMALCIPTGMAGMMASTTMAYVAPVAHCDLEMNLEQRGMLNAIAYVGMITSAFMWGFLADTLGRKKILVAGYFLDGIFVLLAGIAQSYEMLLTAKFFDGLIINGPFATWAAYVSEFHSAKYRTRLLVFLGVVYSLAQLIIPGLAWLVIPNDLNYNLFDGALELHSWNFFLLICSLPSFLSSFFIIFMPESPKFLMTVGRNDEAMRIFKNVYSVNTGLCPDTFPIKSLVDESQFNMGGKHGGLVTANRTKMQALREGWQQIMPMFFPPFLWKIVLVAGIQAGFMLGGNSLRLWLPQIFTAMNDYQMFHPNESASLCTMLGIIRRSENVTTECIVNIINDFVYYNSMIVGAVAVIGYGSTSVIINKLGKKPIMITLSFLSGILAICIYFAQNSATTVALAALNHSFIGICMNIEVAITVDIFPTNLRAIAVSFVLMIGRCGAMFGNVIFPYLLQLGCMPPFVLIGCMTLSCSLFAILLPKTDMKAML